MAQVLIVEDERHIRLLIERILKTMGYEVIEADNGVAALSYIRKHPPDLVLTDLHMPRINGLQLIAHLHREFPTLPIVVVSAYTEQVMEARRIGASYALPKPFAHHQLTELMDRVLPLF